MWSFTLDNWGGRQRDLLMFQKNYSSFYLDLLTLFQARSGITFPSQTGQILPTYTFGYINPLNDFILHKTCSLTNILSYRWLQLPKTALVTKILYVAQNGYGQNLPSLARKRLFQSTFEKPVQVTKFLLLLIFQKIIKKKSDKQG